MRGCKRRGLVNAKPTLYNLSLASPPRSPARPARRRGNVSLPEIARGGPAATMTLVPRVVFHTISRLAPETPINAAP